MSATRRARGLPLNALPLLIAKAVVHPDFTLTETDEHRVYDCGPSNDITASKSNLPTNSAKGRRCQSYNESLKVRTSASRCSSRLGGPVVHLNSSVLPDGMNRVGSCGIQLHRLSGFCCRFHPPDTHPVQDG